MVMRRSSMNVARSRGRTDFSGGTSTTAAPAPAAANTSKIDRSKWSGAWLDRRSSDETANRAMPQSTNVSAFRWESMTPFGSPVEPEVYRM